MGTTKAQASGYGTAAGTAIGSIWGPAGAAVGGALGGAVGGMLGQDPKTPQPVALPPPQLPGGTSGIYQGWTVDPVTGRVVYYDNSMEGQYNPEEYRNQALRDQLLGGNTAQTSLTAQIQAAQQLVDRLSKQSGPAAEGGPKATDFLAPEWVGEDGKPKAPGTINFEQELSTRSPLFKAFEAQVGGKGYGQGSTLDQFKGWVNDAYRNNIQAQVAEYDNALKTSKGNQQTSGEGLDAAKLRLQQLTTMQQSGGTDINNPLMNFLNQRNTTPGDPNYEAQFAGKYADPNIAKMQGETDYYLGKSHENIDFDALRQQLGMGEDPGIPDAKKFNADMQAKYGGAMGGERMDALGAYDSSKLASWRQAQDRVAQNQSASNLRNADNMAAKRGLLGSSINDSSKLEAQMALQDMLVGNAAKTYSMDAQDQNNWFQRKFAIDQHNSDVARQGAQGQASLAASGFGNEMAAKQLYEQIMGNRQNMNTSEQQRAFADMMAALNQRTGLDQRSIDNTRYDVNREQGLDQQNFADRMGLLSFLNGDKSQSFQEEMGRNTAGMQANQQGAGIGMTTTGWGNDYNIANAAQQNAYNAGQFNQGQASAAQDANNWNTLASALGQYGGDLWGGSTQKSAAVPDVSSAPSQSRTIPEWTPPQQTTSAPQSSYPSMFQSQPAAGPTYSLAKPPTSGNFLGWPK